MGETSAGAPGRVVLTLDAMIAGLRTLRSMQLGMDDLDVREHHDLLDAVIQHLEAERPPKSGLEYFAEQAGVPFREGGPEWIAQDNPGPYEDWMTRFVDRGAGHFETYYQGRWISWCPFLDTPPNKEAHDAAHPPVLPAHADDGHRPDLHAGLVLGEEPALIERIQKVRDEFANKGELCATVRFLDALDRLLLEVKR